MGSGSQRNRNGGSVFQIINSIFESKINNKKIMENNNQRPTASKGKRHLSRVLALQTLYACEVGAFSEWQTMIERIAEENAQPANVVAYSRQLLSELYNALESIDSMISSKAANWDIKRMSAIDRNIIRLAIAELCYFPQVPAKVVIDEAVELAKEFGTEDSGKFVNGIIDSIHKNMNELNKTKERKIP